MREALHMRFLFVSCVTLNVRPKAEALGLVQYLLVDARDLRHHDHLALKETKRNMVNVSGISIEVFLPRHCVSTHTLIFLPLAFLDTTYSSPLSRVSPIHALSRSLVSTFSAHLALRHVFRTLSVRHMHASN